MEKIIDEAIKLVAAGELNFLGFVKLLASADVHCYTVDLETQEVVYYAGTKSLVRKLGLDPAVISGRFSEAYLKEAITAVQSKRIAYAEFIKKIAYAGVETYEVDFKTKKITYRGRRKSYVEDFVPKIL